MASGDVTAALNPFGDNRLCARSVCTGGIAHPRCYSITVPSVAGRGRRIDLGGWRKPTNDQPMHWWRAKRSNGAWLALGALLLQLALSFGHVHSEDIAGFGDGPGAAAQSVTISETPTSGSDDHGGNGPVHDECSICAAMHLAGALVLPTPPAIASPGSVDRIAWRSHAEFSLAAARYSLFQSRAPPTA
jgi:hypothetical protein